NLHYNSSPSQNLVGGQPCVLYLNWVRRQNLAQTQADGFNLHSLYSPIPLDASWRPAAPGDPGVDAGADLAAFLTTDRDAVSRPQGAGWDIGPYELTADLPGDADGDGDVDLDDFVILKNAFGGIIEPDLRADFDGDGDIDLDDFVILKTNFGR
ncbi:MAG: hypothetical protein GX591_12785, partial [Planctomycetes bacterium]|nr:hypothetical protein [Planctomycetota bacterium]